MMGKVAGRHRATSNASSRSSVDESKIDSGGNDEDTLVVEPEQGNVLMHIIAQLRPGADLSRVVLPTFILEPRSMLERITNFMCHPEMLLPIPDLDDPVERFVAVVKFYLSGWHIRPPGVKKPLNPILGEVFTCYWDFPESRPATAASSEGEEDGEESAKKKGEAKKPARAFYIAEQTSHHPPKSSYFYMVPEHHIRVDGTLKPRSRFLGNSAASLMDGVAVLSLLNRGEDKTKGERYILTQPNMYARGILFGKMKYELGDHSFVRCPELGLTADIEFKTKGYFGGVYNAIGGFIKNDETGEILYELSGMWSDEMFIRDVKTGQREMFFNGLTAKHTQPLVRPIEEQDERESQRLWQSTAKAVKERNHEVATDEKTKVEDKQREEAAARTNEGVEWHPRLFRRTHGGPGGPDEGEEDLEWIINATIDGDTPEKQAEQVMAIYPIVKGQKLDERHVIPPRGSIAASPDEHDGKETAETGHDKVAAKDDKPADDGMGDLIDFGQDDDPPASNGSAETKPPADKPAAAALPPPATTGSGEIRHMLSTTGKPAETGPLIDFHDDLIKAVPAAKGSSAPPPVPIIKRSDTGSDSHDEFLDAEE